MEIRTLEKQIVKRVNGKRNRYWEFIGVTGNLKHYPISPHVITPAAFIGLIIESRDVI